jgi:dimethylamine/trimethylamine dehydrogenase
LFEPVKIGPVTAPNRFYQVPHCNVLGHGRPRAEAENRRIKAEGGWGVICTQEVEIHPSSEITPTFEGRIWDDRDIPQHRLMTDAVHEYGSLAGIELAYNGSHAPNLYSRIAPMSPSNTVVHGSHPIQARAMNKSDIANVRRWHVEAARRARQAGYDIVYVYAGHDMSLLQHFFKPQYNQRSDEYGGSLENRV